MNDDRPGTREEPGWTCCFDWAHDWVYDFVWVYDAKP